MKDNILRTYL